VRAHLDTWQRAERVVLGRELEWRKQLSSSACSTLRSVSIGAWGRHMARRHGRRLPAKRGRAGEATVIIAVWAAAALKMLAAILPLLALRRSTSQTWNHNLWVLAWIEAGLLAVYGLVLTAVGLMVQAGLISTSRTADHQALAWHAYLWDPWFLIWGFLSRPPCSAAASASAH
jgi:Protein of unknown function (DUF3995)